jgi:hypothetical protein
VRYPWWTVDSVTAKKNAYYSQILVPPSKGGEFCFDKPYQLVFIDSISPYTDRGNKPGRHFLAHKKPEQEMILKWLRHIEVRFGRRDKNGVIEELGVSNSSQERMAANMHYFLRLERSLPKWPWAFRLNPRPTLLEVVNNGKKRETQEIRT